MSKTVLDYCGNKKVEISSCSHDIIRVRISEEFAPSIFERYNIYRHASEEAGEVVQDGTGISSGDLTVLKDGDSFIIRTGKCERRFTLNLKAEDEIKDYFNKELDCFLLPDEKPVIGSDSVQNKGFIDINKDPKYMVLDTEGEIFYGLGESSKKQLKLNGNIFLERVSYGTGEIPIPYIMTKSGYAIMCNTTIWHGVDVCKKEKNKVTWYLPDTEFDFLIFAGETLDQLIERFTFFTGRPILLPKWAYGLTFIDQYYADQFEVMRNAERFRKEELPCDTISLEPGWMETIYDKSVNKKWNLEKFSIWEWSRNGKEPERYFFSGALKRYGFKLQLWLACDHDFTAYEETLAGNREDFGIPKWFDHLRNFKGDGAESFKMDPCRLVESPELTHVFANGMTTPECHNLIQTLYAKEMYYGAAKFNNRRPMHHYCGGYISTGAYSAATTGDSGGREGTLAWVLNLGLSGNSNVTCDMNVHSKESIHYGFFTAWCQLNSWVGFCHPWWAGEENEKTFRIYDLLRYRLMPYIYSSAINANICGMPVCRAMPYVCDDEEVSDSVTEYMFGDSFLVSAFTDEIYLPEGTEYIDYWTHEKQSGGKTIKGKIPQDRGGYLFVKEGAIIPCDLPRQYIDCKDTDKMEIEIYPGKDNTFTMYEDDGLSLEYKEGKRAKTVFSLKHNRDEIIFLISEREGAFENMASDRLYTVKMLTDRDVKQVSAGEEIIDYSVCDGYLVFDVPVDLKKGKQCKIIF